MTKYPTAYGIAPHPYTENCCDWEEAYTIHCATCEPQDHCTWPQMVSEKTTEHNHEMCEGSCTSCGVTKKERV